MKTGLVKVQGSADRKTAQVFAGHAQQPPRTAYDAVNHRICKVVGQYTCTIEEHFGIFAWYRPQRQGLNCLLFQ